MTRLTRQGPAPAPGVVHFGLGAFYRAHGAVYFQRLMDQSGGDWGITGISLKSPGMRDRLTPQGGVYTLVEQGPAGRNSSVISSVRDVLVAPEAPGRVLDALDTCQLVTITVTEKGYCHAPATGALNVDLPDIRADLANPQAPATLIGFLVAGLARRRDAGRDPFTVLSCDNLPHNGHMLRALVLEFATRTDPDLAAWIETRAKFPCAMVDRIVPATTEADIRACGDDTGLHDAAPVQCEPFSQWVIEDDFVPGTRPALDRVGAELVADVAPYEHMKLRMLNGTHSALAYLGYLAGCETIADAVSEPALSGFARHLWHHDIIPVLTAPDGVDLTAYADTLMRRYANPAIRHLTWQIAMDGSQKLPQRILDTLSENLSRGRDPQGLFLVLAAWMRFSSGQGLDGAAIDVRDPLAARLAANWQTDDVVAAYLAMSEVFSPDLARDPRLYQGLTTALEHLTRQGALEAAAAIAG